MNQNRKKYDKKFKQKAVELSYVRGNAKEIADMEEWKVKLVTLSLLCNC
jgi:hypothetical protein